MVNPDCGYRSCFLRLPNKRTSSACCGRCTQSYPRTHKLSCGYIPVRLNSLSFTGGLVVVWSWERKRKLPGFVTITPPNGFGGAQNYGSGFLPAVNQATRIGSDNRPVSSATLPYLEPRVSRQRQQADLALIDSFNQAQKAAHPEDEAIDGVIESYELAFKMQSELPAS